jgi:VWFA-related protein
MRYRYLAFSLTFFAAAFASPQTPAAPAPAQPAAQNPAAQVPAAQVPAAQDQDLAAPQPPLFRLDVRRVPVDVVVLDKQGKPVRGLTKDDLIVKENGEVQSIASFDAIDGTVPSFVPPKLPALPTNTFVNLPTEPERGPLYILYYDMVNTPQEDQMAFHRQLFKFIDDAQPGTRIAIFLNAAGLHLLQGFTSDHALLHAALERKGPGPHMPDVFLSGRTFGASDWGAALSNLKFMAEYVDGMSGRKNLLWLASVFPIPVGPTLVTAPGGLASQATQSGSVGLQGGPQVLDLYSLAPETIKHAYAALMRSQVALYPISLRGIAGSSDAGGASDSLADYRNMDVIASATGGHAYYSNNKPEVLIDQAVAHGESFYTLSYAPTNADYDGSERRIQVTMKDGQDYTLTYRSVYYALPDDPAPARKGDAKTNALQARFLAAKAKDTLYANVEHGAPMLHDLLFSAHLAPTGSAVMATSAQMLELQDSPAFFRTRHKDRPLTPLTPVKLQKYTIDYGVIDPQLKVEAKRNGSPAILEFAAAAYDPDGKMLNSQLNDGVASTDAKHADKTSATFRAEQQLLVPAGAASIRIVVRDKATDRTGSLEVPLPLKTGTQTANAAK